MGIIARAAENYVAPTAVVRVWLDSSATPKRREVAQKLLTQQQLVETLANQKPAEDNSDGRLGQPELKRARQNVTKLQRELAEVEAAEAEHAHLLQFTKLDGIAWSNLASLYQPRSTSRIDNEINTNYHATGLAAAKVSGKLLALDPEGSIEFEGKRYRPEPIDDDDWATIQTVGAGYDVENIAWTNLELNVLHASNQLGRLVKG